MRHGGGCWDEPRAPATTIPPALSAACHAAPSVRLLRSPRQATDLTEAALPTWVAIFDSASATSAAFPSSSSTAGGIVGRGGVAA